MKSIAIPIAATLLVANFSAIAAPIELSFGVEVDAGSPQAAVGETLEEIVTSLSGATELDANGTELLSALQLVRDNPTTAQTALETISPKSNSTNNSFIKKMPSFNHVQSLGKRLSTLRRKTSSYTGRGFRINGMPLPSMLSSKAVEAGGLMDNRLSVFYTGDLLISQQTETVTESGFSGTIGRVSTGVDYRFAYNFFAGIYASMFYGNIDLEDNSGKLKTDEQRLAMFASYYPFQNVHLDLALGSALRHFDLSRKIQFTIVDTSYDRTATSEPGGNNLEAIADLGLDLPLQKGVTLSFNTRASFSQSTIEAFTESDGGGFSLTVDKQQVRNINASVGSQLNAVISTSWSVLAPYIKAAYIHEFENTGDDIRARFTYDPGNNYFSYKVMNTDSDYIDLTAGTSAIFAGGFSAFMQVSSLLLFDNFTRVAVVVGARSEF